LRFQKPKKQKQKKSFLQPMHCPLPSKESPVGGVVFLESLFTFPTDF
jgi:hypothetical protein